MRNFVPERPPVRAARHGKLEGPRAQLLGGDGVHAVPVLDRHPARGPRAETALPLRPAHAANELHQRVLGKRMEVRRYGGYLEGAHARAAYRNAYLLQLGTRPDNATFLLFRDIKRQREEHLLHRRRTGAEAIKDDPLVGGMLVENKQSAGELEDEEDAEDLAEKTHLRRRRGREGGLRPSLWE